MTKINQSIIESVILWYGILQRNFKLKIYWFGASGGQQGLAHAGDAKILEEININQKLLAQVRVAL
jgi:hypothetical protein